jgi:cbb3-type cytochrome oxidase subunit 1
MSEKLSTEFVEDSRLQDLIDSGEIFAFRRSEGWATVIYDPIRVQQTNYNGPDRRKQFFIDESLDRVLPVTRP